MADFYGKYSGLFGGGGGGGATYTFADSIVNNSGTVTLVNDTATPGNNQYYGTNGSGTLGYYTLAVTATGNLTDVGTDGIVITGGNGAVVGTGTSIAQHVADTTHNGYLSSVDWNTFNGKQPALTIGNLTDVGTDGIVITGGMGAVIGTGTSIAQHVADTTHSGYLSSTDWNTFNGKQATLTIGNLTDVGTDGIVVTGGTGSVIGTGTSIAQHVADTTHNGYLSSVDWNTFNGKQAAGSYITALVGDVSATGPGSVTATLATVNTNIGTFAVVTVNGKGLTTAASAISGDATTSGAALTLATVNANVGSFTNANITVNAKGLVTAAANGTGGSSPVLAIVHGSPGATSSNTPIIFPTVDVDTNSAYSNSTGQFTAPNTGYYMVRYYLTGDGNNRLCSVYVNGSKRIDTSNSDTTGSGWQTGTGVVQANSGQTIDIRPSNTLTGNAGDNAAFYQIH